MRPNRIAIGIAVAIVAIALLLEHLYWAALAVPSLTTLLLVLDPIVRRATHIDLLTRSDRKVLVPVVALFAIVFYPMAKGLLPFDVYRFGYTPWAPAVLALIGCIVAMRSMRVAAAIFVMLVALDVHLIPSNNVFDYVIDPVGGIAAIVTCVVWLGVTVLSRS